MQGPPRRDAWSHCVVIRMLVFHLVFDNVLDKAGILNGRCHHEVGGGLWRLYPSS